MLTVTPHGSIYLCKTPLENDYKNQLTFTNLNSQETYFNSKITNTFNNYTYIKNDNTIKISENIDNIRQCNYLFYKNTGFTNKTFYCFITNMQYINENCTAITIETDVFQTWYFQIQYNPCFIEREHVSDDTIGLHTIPENLETGDYVCNEISSIDLGLKWYVIGCTKQYDLNFANGGGIYNGIFSGKTYYAVRTTADLQSLLSAYDQAGFGSDVSEIFIVPAKLIGNPSYDSNNPIHRVTESVLLENCGNITLSIQSSLNGYTPKNNKLLTHPYNYILVDNNAGNSVDYKYELFNNIYSITFTIIGSLSVGTSMTLLPQNYIINNSNSNPIQNTPDLLNHSLSLGKYPSCNWNTDIYTNWLTQNALNLQWNLFSNVSNGLVGGVTSGSSGGLVGGLVGGTKGLGEGVLAGVTQNMLQTHNQSFSPNQSKGNANSGDVITSANANKPFFYKMSIKQEFAKIIDNYFSMFGYKVNTVKTPTIKNRQNWNYTKTIDCNLDGDIPQSDLNKIKQMFNTGVTFWHNPNNIYNYNLSNNII